MSSKRFDCYECDEDDCDQSKEQSSICENAIYCWKSTIREEDNNKRYARGCIIDLQQMRLVCNNKLQKGNSKYRTECCQKQLCNDGAFPLLQDSITQVDVEQGMGTAKITLAILAALLSAGLIVLALLYCRRHRKSRSTSKKHNSQQQPQQQEIELRAEPSETPQAGSSNIAASSTYSLPELKVTAAGDSTLKEYLDGQSLTSGSGSGQPLLMQRTLSKQISLVERLNSGSFGQPCELWRGIWQGESIAVKIYSSRSEVLWARETEVYTQLLPSKHDNILGYLGSDTTSAASCTQLWLVTHYHPNGSLRSYLREQSFDYNEMFKVCLSLTYGLLYLHTEIHGTQGKSSIAHRNLSSKNVFVKNDGTCVIADFGHAVTLERLDDTNFLEHVSKRYMSPELLKNTFDPNSLEGFRQVDIYSLGLIFWEICRRCSSNKNVALDYAAPYSEWLTSSDHETALEEMRKLVVVDQRRPDIPDYWQSDQTLAGMGTVIKECWHTKAAARLPILRVKKTLTKLASENPDVDLPLN